jgi:hypothetical protein
MDNVQKHNTCKEITACGTRRHFGVIACLYLHIDWIYLENVSEYRTLDFNHQVVTEQEYDGE